MANVKFMYRADIGFEPGRGYAAALRDVSQNRLKGIKANSIRQLMRRISEAICEDEQKKRRFPLEHEAPVIITPDQF